jgi:preprotein translocase subunit YajC
LAHSTYFALQAVGPKAGAPGTVAPSTTQDASSSSSSAQQSSPQSTLILLAPMVVVVAFMLFTGRNQRKREAETRSKLKKGERVVSTSGLVGELVDMDDNLAKVKIAPGTNVQMLISSISPFVAPTATTASQDKTLKDLKDAKSASATAEKKG